MERRSRSKDQLLVRECLAGSEEAWKEFYARFVGLMRCVVRRNGGLSQQDVEDVIQSAFLSLTTALNNYDFEESLPRFVCLVTERVLVDQYRRTRAVKRGSEKEISTGLESGEEGPAAIRSGQELQDDLVAKAELASHLRQALEGLDPACRDLLTYRYFMELSFNEIAQMIGASENTVTVRTRRCVDKLRARLERLQREGSRR